MLSTKDTKGHEEEKIKRKERSRRRKRSRRAKEQNSLRVHSCPSWITPLPADGID
jgi:hypothetical protein